MIIWDKKKKEHFIRINGKGKTRIKAADFQVVGTNEQIETTIKTAVDAKVSDENYHVYIYLLQKQPLRYQIWLGKMGTEPRYEDQWQDLTS